MQPEWTAKRVKARFREAVLTLSRLRNLTSRDVPSTPSSKWPPVGRPDRHALLDVASGRVTSAEVSRLDEAIAWACDWLEDYERHLVWDRARGISWKVIERRHGYHRTTGWRHYVFALIKIAIELNAKAGKAPGHA